jgi:hypothetical protein
MGDRGRRLDHLVIDVDRHAQHHAATIRVHGELDVATPRRSCGSAIETWEDTMKTRTPQILRRFLSVGVAGVLMVMVAACTGVGGGYLPPDPTGSFTGQASFGFTFSCEDKGGLNPPTGKLSIQLDYLDHGTSPFLGAPFWIHGIVDEIDPVLESEVCIGQNPPPGGQELIFLGRFRLASSPPPPGYPATCPARETKTSPLCRFEVIVRDNDGNLAPSTGDYFSIQLSSATAVTSELDPLYVFYARAGFLQGGNITVN